MFNIICHIYHHRRWRNNYIASPLWLAVCPRSYKDDYLQNFKCISFHYTAFVVSGENEIP